MTLLVGIKYSGGAVIAADKQATHGSIASLTVGLPTTKIEFIGAEKRALFASSGPIGLGQQFAHAVEEVHKQFGERKYSVMVPIVQKKLREILDPAFSTARLAAHVIGAAAQQDVICGCLLAAKFKDGVSVSEISPQAGMEVLTDKIPFVCIGSGKQNADPFLRYIWSVFFSGGKITLSDASLAAYWTVKTAIDLKSPNVGFDVDVFVLDEASGGKQLSSEELQEHIDFIRAAEESLRSVKDGIVAKNGLKALPTPEMKKSS